MFKFRKIFKFVFVLTFLFYILISLCFSNGAKAGTRTEDINNLVNYPEIYTAVQELKTAHPNWTFTILYTGLDWNYVLQNETTLKHTRSLVHNSLTVGNISDWVCPICGTTPQDNGSWYCASNKTASYYIDPRNWLNDTYIFAFETLSFNENVHTIEGVQAIISGTFMDKSSISYIDTSGAIQTIEKSYAQIIYEAGKNNNVSPYHLAARIRQEQGNGTSSLISGNVAGFTGYYNYFNIGASGNTTAEIITNGLTRAINSGWSTPELAINGGAEFLKGGYIGNYQDTLYLQKYHVDSSSKYSLFGHQYQQNVSAPYTESLDVYDAYEELGIIDSNFNFIIPIYDNMPAVASEKPGRPISIHSEDVIVNTESTPLSIRSGPSTNYSIKAKAPRGTTLIRIERSEEISSDGRYWDRVIYNTGAEIIIGYASREYLLEATTTEVLNDQKEIEIMCNLRSGPATTNTKVIKILQPGTKITIIDKVIFPVDGHTWYRAKLEDGTQGYVSEAYLKTEASELYKIEDNTIKVSPTTKITDIPNAILTGEVFGTGAKLTIAENEYTVVMIGDVNGDGTIDSADLLKIVKHLKEIALIETEVSADINKDGVIDSADLLKIVKYLKGLSTIEV